MALVAIAAVVTATAVSLVAGAFALYAVLEPSLGRAGAAAIVAVAFALFVLIGLLIALLATRNGGGHHKAGLHDHDSGLTERLIEIVKAKPILSAAAAVAGGLLIIRNPVLVGVVLKAFMDSKSAPKS